MTEKQFNYIQLGGLTDHRPFIAPGVIGWMQSMADPVHVMFLVDMPGVDGTRGIPTQETDITTILVNGDQIATEQRKYKTLVFNFGLSAMQGFFMNDLGIGCMMRFGGDARSIFIPFSAMLSVYCPRGIQNANIFGYDPQVPAVSLCNVITPGMLEALTGTAPEVTAPPPPKSEEPAPRPSFLTPAQPGADHARHRPHPDGVRERAVRIRRERVVG
jgi:stringent starvation protein B